MRNSAHQYGGQAFGRGQRLYSKTARALQPIDLERLEELLGKNPAVTEPLPPLRNSGGKKGKGTLKGT